MLDLDAPDLTWTRYAVPVGDGVVEQGWTRAADGEAMDFIASTAGEASDGDIIDQDSWQLGRYRSNPIVLYEHAVPVIGTATVNRGGKGDPLRASITFDDAPENPTARLAAHQHATGVRNAVSVRWLPGKLTARNKLDKGHAAYAEPKEVDAWWGGKIEIVGRFHQQNTLLEISSVAIPSDPRALQVRGAHSLTASQLRSALSGSGVVRTIRDNLLDLLRADPEVRGTLRALLATARTPTPKPILEALDDPRIRAALADLRSTLTTATP